ncbi:transglutaminase [Bosea sp. Root381]|uniref:transglutaminase-like domain-containing protein n=1 Tax=Bosea sp. Root381 TaxID=1736524 RepID=UPI0006F2E8F5|nr:transglutaminase family protein [Bosea sp. Root381]KRE05017.1 transglutaminase [Bosea sp. Root381]
MKVRASAELIYDFAEPTQIIGLIEAALTEDQAIISEALTVTPHRALLSDVGVGGDRRMRACLSGTVTISYQADVDNGHRLLLPVSGRQHSWSELPADTLTFLLPSRFCPSDQFQRYALREFGQAGDGVARVMAVLDWIDRNLDYVAGVSTPETTAAQTFTVRAGVCRDFTHLAITFCRALSIPARAVSAYAVDLQPADFHAVVEVFVENQWWLIDPTRLAPVEGLVRIAHGRDAADIAFLTTNKPCQLISQTIAAEAI